jgi:hypothetical protein
MSATGTHAIPTDWMMAGKSLFFMADAPEQGEPGRGGVPAFFRSFLILTSAFSILHSVGCGFAVPLFS